MFDWVVEPSRGWSLAPWSTLVPAFTYSPSLPYHQLLVPNVDTTRCGYMLEALMARGRWGTGLC